MYSAMLAAVLLISTSVFGRDIHLSKVGTKGTSDRPRTGEPAVSADLTDNVVTIDVDRYLGSAIVVIEDESGTTCTTDSSSVYGHAAFTLDVSGLIDGNYTITISLSDGTTLQGSFTL